MNFKTINDIGDIAGKKIIVRVDFNVPVLSGGIIGDDFRIQKVLPTIKELRHKGAKVILMSHFEGLGGTLLPVVNYLHLYFPVLFIKDIFSDSAREVVNEMKNGDVVLFENLRQWEGEKGNDREFSKHLASFGDVYMNEAFASSHRSHASIVGIPEYLPHYAGISFAREVEELSHALSPKHPFLFILGGAKFSTKLPLLKKFLSKADTVMVGGALMNNFYKAQDLEVGDSLVDEGEDFDVAGMLENNHLFLPSDVVVKTEEGEVEVRLPSEIEKGDIVMDVGPETLVDLQMHINKASFILWNGPLGNYEVGFAEGTNECAHRIAESGKESVIGGGDTLAVVSKLHLLSKFSFVSSAGGAMLDFLAHETLPGIEALR